MHGVARNFFALAVVYAVVGMTLGLHMSITKDHGQMPTHAHIMVAGWLMSAVVAFFYHLVPQASRSWIATAHFWLAAASGIALMGGLYLLLGGNEAVEPVVALGSLGFYAATLLFAFIAIRTLYGSGTVGVPVRDASIEKRAY